MRTQESRVMDVKWERDLGGISISKKLGGVGLAVEGVRGDFAQIHDSFGCQA